MASLKLGVLIALVLPTMAAADPYVTVGGSPDQLTGLDIQSINQTATTKRAWRYITFEVSTGGMKHGASLHEYDCSEKRTRLLSQTYFDTRREPLGTTNKVGPWEYAVPGSMGWVSVQAVCDPTSISKDAIIDFDSPYAFFEASDRVFSRKGKRQ